LNKLRASHDATSTDAGASRKAHEKRSPTGRDRDKLRGELDTASKELAELRTQHKELSARKETKSASRTALEKSLADISKNRDELLAKLETMAANSPSPNRITASPSRRWTRIATRCVPRRKR